MNSDLIFQIDHPLICSEYNKDNYKIILDDSVVKGTCAIYFCSHNIYYPNEENEFKKQILEKDFYEWFKIRVNSVHKHIFLRDIHKQWYLSGINSQLNSPDKLLQFLVYETKNCKVTVLGSSAGGYAAVLYGSLLKANKVFSFNGQMEINSLLESSNNRENPLLFKFKNTNLRKYYDLKPFLFKKTNIFYFYSLRSEWDAQQASHVLDVSIERIGLKSSRHGIPFLKCALSDVLNFSDDQLLTLSKKIHNPILFSIYCSGLRRVFTFCCELLYKTVRNKILIFFKGVA